MLPPPMRLVLVLAVVVGFDVRAGAQSGQHRTALLQSPPSPMIVSPPRHALPFASSGLVTQGPGDFHGSYGFRITRDYRLQNPGSLSSFQETKTSFATESRLPVAQIWGARLQLNFFVVTLYSRNVMLGPLASNEAFHRPRQLRSVDLYGIGVSVPLGRNARWEDSKGPWRNLSRIVHGDGWPQLSPSSLNGPQN